MRYFTREEINKVSFGTDDGFSKMESDFLLKLDQLRHNCGFPMTLTSVFRTREWDLSKGRSGNSKHTLGIAVDIKCNTSTKRAIIVEEAFKLGFKGIGVHKDFVHVDTRDKPVMWLY